MTGQLRLIWVPAKLHLVSFEHAMAAAAIDRPDLMASVLHFGAGRGWSKQTTRQVQRSVAVLLEARCDRNRIDQSMLSSAADLSLVSQRSIEFLQSAGLQLVDPEARIQSWVNAKICHLPERVRQEVDSWIQVLTGRSARRTAPLKAQTVKVYLQVCLPVLNRWTGRYNSLRQVTSDDIEQILNELGGWEAVNTLTGLRSLFRTLKANRTIFADPARGVRWHAPPPRAPLGLDPSVRRTMLDQLARPDHRLIVMLAGIHALSVGQIVALQLDHLDLARSRMLIKGQFRPLDELTREQLVAWLRFRRNRWPNTANPHVLVTAQSANNLQPVGPTYLKSAFDALPVTASQLRVDRLVGEALDSRGDALRISMMFGMSPDTAAGYASAFSELDEHRALRPHGPGPVENGSCEPG